MSLYLKETKNGKGVCTSTPIKSGDKICDFKGKLFKLIEIPAQYESFTDHYVQIGVDLYMGPSGDVDDYVNHSCDPNSGLHIEGSRVELFAIRDIGENEEITWDYSTTMFDDDWELKCNCGSSKCRGVVREFKFLPESLRNEYIKLGVVPNYVFGR